jgi:endo-1,4-beta-xylanase
VRRPSRRAALAGALALSACSREGGAAAARPYGAYGARRGPTPALRELATCPVGTCLSTAELQDPAYLALVARHCSQIVPSWQLQIDATLKPDGRFDFADADRIAAAARAGGQSLHATSLLWYAQEPEALKALDGSGPAFTRAVENWITAAAGRYRGQAVSWDAVNEPIEEDGSGLRRTLYGRNLGAEDYMVRAFEWAHAADADAVLVLNDFDLERVPAKRAAFLRLAERLLKRNVPLGALGTQCHLDIGVDPALVRPAMRELASLGLPVRVSELDCSIKARGLGFLPMEARLDRQARLYAETAAAFVELPAHQRLAFCVWGLDDRRSWLRYQAGGADADDRPLPFDDADGPKPAFWALADQLGRA